MRYIVDLIARYQSAWGFVSGTLAGEAEGLANAGIFKAGIAFNEAKWKGRNGNEAKYDAPVYAPTDWTWAEMVMKHEGKEMNFSFGSLKENSTGVFAPPPLMRFRRTKNITVTVIDGGNEAEVVENFGGDRTGRAGGGYG